MKSILMSLALAAVLTQDTTPTMPHYGDDFADHYPEIAKTAPILGSQTPLEPEVIVWSTLKNRKATLLRSDGSKVPYEKEIGSITIEYMNKPKQYLLLKGFRNVDLTWINDRLLYLSEDIGHIAGVDSIFDAETGRWIYRQSVNY